MFVIIAHGPNLVEIPCLFFKKQRTAENFLLEKGCTKRELKDRNTGEIHFWYSPPEKAMCEDDYADGFFVPDFFTNVYFGCGGVGGFVIREIQEGKSFIGFNLD